MMSKEYSKVKKRSSTSRNMKPLEVWTCQRAENLKKKSSKIPKNNYAATIVSAARRQIIGGGGAPINKSRRRRRPQIVGLVQKSRTKVSCTNSISIVRGGLILSGGFCPCWFLSVPLVSQYICYNRKLNITLNFMFHMYDKNLYKRDVTCS